LVIRRASKQGRDEMKLRFLRFMEYIFSIPAAYFGDLADAIDTELHEDLRIAMKDLEKREIYCNMPDIDSTP